MHKVKSSKDKSNLKPHQLELEPFKPNLFLTVVLRIRTNLTLVFITPVILMVVAFINNPDSVETSSDSTRLRSLPRLYLFVVVTLFLFMELQTAPKSQTVCLAPSQQYVTLYISFIVLCVFIFAFAGLERNSLFIRFIVAGGALALLLCMIFAIPVYNNSIHFISAGLNLFIIVVFALALYLRDLFPALQTQSNDTNLLFVVVFLIVVSTFAHIGRLIHVIMATPCRQFSEPRDLLAPTLQKRT